MDVLSSRVDQALTREREYEFTQARSNFSSVESIFGRINSQFSNSEQAFLIKNFQEKLAEFVYNSLQGNLEHLRRREKAVDSTNLVNTSRIVQHENIIKENPVIIEIEGKITNNQSQIIQVQNQLNSMKASPAIMLYQAISREVNSLKEDETGFLNLIAQKSAKGEDTTILEEKLVKIREKIKQKEKELSELQPQYDAMKEIEQALEDLLKENSQLIKQRFSLDKEFVRYTQVYTFFDQVIKGNGNGLGVEADLSRNKNQLSKAEESYQEKATESSTFKELLNKNSSVWSNAKSDLDFSKALRQEKENYVLQIKS